MGVIVRKFLDPAGRLWALQEIVPGVERPPPPRYAPGFEWRLQSESPDEVVYRATALLAPRPESMDPGPSLPSHARPAFTLIELLFCIATISVLIGLSLPSLRRARDAARNAVCLSNLRQIA